MLLIENESNVDFELGKWKAVVFRCIIDNGKVIWNWIVSILREKWFVLLCLVNSYKKRNDLNAKMIAKHVYTDVSWETALMEFIRKGDAHSTNLIIKNCVKTRRILTQSLQIAALKGTFIYPIF